MPLFSFNKGFAQVVKPKEFGLEKELQRLIEENLETIFNCRMVASEFSTGVTHGGRIDTLALSEENNPVIIEYKKVQSAELINQGLFYLAWIQDHRGDFQVAVERKLGKKAVVDWSDVRVICIAPGYRKHDLFAVQMMRANIELWEYRVYENQSILLEEVFKRGGEVIASPSPKRAGKSPQESKTIDLPVEDYTFEDQAKRALGEIRLLADEFREFVTGLSESIEERPKKLYVAYKVTQNFVCLEVHQKKLCLFLKAGKEEFEHLPKNGRDVRTIGHFGTGDLELTIQTRDELEQAKPFIRRALAKVGGV